MNPRAMYLHFPFCVRKCGYCSFVSGIPADKKEIETYVADMHRELELRALLMPGTVMDSIYFGGGTPSLMSTELLDKTIKKIKTLFHVVKDVEITLEANPASVGADGIWCHETSTAGVSRISVGVQSLRNQELVLLGRAHNVEQAANFFSLLKKQFFKSVGIDLIYGLPGQTLNEWNNTLCDALKLSPDHVSLYCLEIDTGTVLCERVKSGEVATPHPDTQADMYYLALKILGEAGFTHYEISSWAQQGCESKHNLGYWTGKEYIGVGVSACGYLNGWRLSNVKSISEYRNRISGGVLPMEFSEKLSSARSLRELAVMRLRTMKIRPADFTLEFDEKEVIILMEILNQLANEGLLDHNCGEYTIPDSMLFVSDEIFRRII